MISASLNGPKGAEVEDGPSFFVVGGCKMLIVNLDIVWRLGMLTIA